jgi:glucose-6-phosphate 1-epimerase
MPDVSSITLTAADGARAVISPFGAHVLSWRPASGGEQLFLSRSAVLDGSKPIRGGVPVIFPQFAGEGPLPKHGFARTSPWQFLRQETLDSGSAIARFGLCDNAATRALWPYPFAAELAVTVGGAALRVALEIHNTGSDALAFTAALHTYLAVDDSAAVEIVGLSGLGFRDTANGNVRGEQHETALRIAGEVDRIYFDAPAHLQLREPGRTLELSAVGFPDAVVWNPGAVAGAALGDLEPGGYARMLCIEPAVIGRPVLLAPGGTWRGGQGLRLI